MRKYINVLWLDDNDASSSINSFRQALSDFGYDLNVIPVNTIEEADAKMGDKNERIDFFVSDFSLSEEDENQSEKDGYNFLVDIRKKGRIKEFFVLYSHLERKSIVDLIFKDIKKEKDSVLFSNNFSFVSTGGLSSPERKAEFKRCIEMALARWNELSALRGEYASLNTLLESVTRKILRAHYHNNGYDNELDYNACISRFKSLVNSAHPQIVVDTSINISDVFTKWNNCRKERNTLEHNPEKWDSSTNDFFVRNPSNGAMIYERDISDYRKKLLDAFSSVVSLLESAVNLNSNLLFLLSDEDYVNLRTDC